MNRYFIPGEGRREIPNRVYARVDQVEPPNLEAAETVTVALDAIDADWPHFSNGGSFDLVQEGAGADGLAQHWDNLFHGAGDLEQGEFDALFDDLPLFQIEVTLPRRHGLIERLLDEPSWLELTFDRLGGIEADVFGGLFMQSIQAHVQDILPVSTVVPVLEALFGTPQWPFATTYDLCDALPARCRIDELIMLDVGQGSANALACPHGFVQAYFDAGCGVYRNHHTRPQTLEFCVCNRPPVILSHWDSDHWAGACVDRDLLERTWIVPSQPLGLKHVAFGRDILRSGGRILMLPPNVSSMAWDSAGQRLELRRCTGCASDRNASGLVLIVEDKIADRSWLLTGDAPYNAIPGPLPGNVVAVVVPHHGADMGPASRPPVRGPHPYARLLYSFGPGNAHGRTGVRHPTAATVDAHVAANWPHGAWEAPPVPPPPPGTNIAGSEVLATAQHSTNHLGGARVGWASAPSPKAASHVTCPKSMPANQI